METIGEVKQTMAMDLGSLLDAGDGAVVTLVVGDTHLVAHRAVLAARSPVFAAMLSQNSSESSSGQVRIPDVEGPVLRQLLAYCYTLQAPQLPDMALKLLVAADKYRVSVLKAECEKQVVAQLSVETAAAAAVTTIRHSCTVLREAAIGYMKTHIFEVMATQGWADTVRTQTEDVIQLNRLLFETSVPLPGIGGTSPTPTSQLRSDRSDCSQTTASAAPPMTASCHSPPPDDTAVPCLSVPAPVDGGDSPTTQPHSDQGDCSRNPDSAASTMDASCQTLQLDDAAVSRLRVPAPVDGGNSPTTRPHSDQGDCSRNPDSAAPTMDASCQTTQLDDAAVSRLRRLSAEEKNRRLIEAAKQGVVGLLEALLAAGADVAARDTDRRTALQYAADGGHEEAARRLLAAGAAVNHRDKWQWTPLLDAAGSGHAAVVRLLLDNGADHTAGDVDGWTPLHWAAVSGHTEAAAALLQGGADRGARDSAGHTPLDIARWTNRQQLVHLLQGR